MVMAFFYDLLRVRRRTVKAASFVVQIEDFLYWVAAAVFMLVVVYYSNEGEVRGYIFLGAAMGAILYALTLSRIVMSVFLTLVNLLRRVLRVVWRVSSWPFYFLFKILRIPCGFLLRSLIKAGRRAVSIQKGYMARGRIWKKMMKNLIKKV